MNVKVSTRLEKRVRKKIESCLNRIELIWKYKHPFPKIYFDILIADAGWAFDQTNEIHFNPILLNENSVEFIKTIVPHEVAHVVAPRIFKKNVKTHGNEWKAIMGVLGVKPEIYHSFDSKNCKKYNIKRFIYKCDCSTFHFGKNKHDKLMKKRVDDECNYCYKKIKYCNRFITI